MEVREIAYFFKKVSKKLLAFFVIGGLIGFAVFTILSIKYVSSGTFYIGRKVAEHKDFYAYSGYYDQQTAISYTDTVRGLLESRDIKAMLLEKLNTDTDARNLRRLSNKVRVKDKGPQLVEIEIRENSRESGEKTFLLLADIIDEINGSLGEKSDRNLSIQKVKDLPVTRRVNREPFVFGLAGGLFSLTTGTFILGFKDYMQRKENDDQV